MKSALLVLLLLLTNVSPASPAAFRRGQVSGLGAAFRSYRLNSALAFGGLGVGLGVAGAVLASKAVTDGEKSTAGVALGVGTGLAVGAVLLTFLRNPYERAADEFLRLSANEDAEAVERRFQTLVAQERRERKFVGIVNLVASGALIGIGLASSSNTRELLVGIGVGGAASSLLALFLAPPAPYEALGETRSASSSPAPVGFQLGLAPLPGGLSLASGFTF